MCFNCTGRRVEGDKRQQEASERERVGLAEAAELRADGYANECAAGTCDECRLAYTSAENDTHGEQVWDYLCNQDDGPLRVPLIEVARIA